MKSTDSSLFPGDNGLKSKGTGFRGAGQTD
jgi:hypothetical protein